MLKHVDLCSGIGGFALGFEWAGLSRPVMFCDIEPWSRKVLAKHWPDVPIEEDVKVLANEPEKIPAGGRDTILTAGYPCQPFSQAGKRRGTEDDRHIWPYIREIVAHKRPSWCVFENVYGHVSMGLDEVLSDLEADGYATRPFIVPACGVDAPHRRDRVWIIARDVDDTKGDRGERNIRKLSETDEGAPRPQEQHKDATIKSDDASEHTTVLGDTEDIGRHGWAEATRREGQTHQQDEPRLSVWGELSRPSKDVANPNNSGNRTQRDDPDTEGQKVVKGWEEQSQYQFSRQRQDVADTDSIGQERRTKKQVSGVRDREGQSLRGSAPIGNVWTTEPSVCRVANGIPRRVDRIKGLGNAIVPQIAMQIGLTIKDCRKAMGG